MLYKKPNEKRLQAICNRFNASCQVGGRVVVKIDFSDELRVTKTRSEAYVLSGHSAVVMLEGISGSYCLTHVRVEPFDEAAVLAFKLFDGNVVGTDRIKQDKIITAKKGGSCYACPGEIAPGDRVRAMAGVFDGKSFSYRWCQGCCERMAVGAPDPFGGDYGGEHHGN